MSDVHDRIRTSGIAMRDLRPLRLACGLRSEAATWRAALRRAPPEPPVAVLDAGAGTGSLSLLAAELGYRVTALDLSEAMLEGPREGRRQGARAPVRGRIAMAPPGGPFDAVIERHLLWTMPDPRCGAM